MSTESIVLVYWGGIGILFFFWVYGIASFGFDLKNKLIPGLLQYRRGRRKLADEKEEESEREKREQRLY